ncbi:MAG: homoserine O-acetyltransferase [Deferribacteraceae bacterium]|jgi:homoserine O-acetyltransferase|nr:homoserine O-acetyltransferase [Deferribacteraceae bacterium]
MQKTFNDVLYLESGRMISPVTIAYETYGKLSSKKNNAILLCHALTGSARVAGTKDNPGWWEPMVGAGKAFDTDRYFVICSNILGSCYGTTGPSSIDPYTGEPYALRFPVITVKDMVVLQKRLIEYLGIERLYCVAGSSLGGMQALSWAVTFPEMTARMIAISTARNITPMAIAFNTVARYAITKDPFFCDGNYYGKTPPNNGLAIGRMAGHITYLSDAAFNRKFGRRYATFEGIYDFNGFFEVENYLRYNGYKFTDRFDANSYLYLLKAMDIFDIEYGYSSFEAAMARITAKALFITFTSDTLFPEYQTADLVNMMKKINNPPVWARVESDYGHDSFLLEFDKQTEHIREFLG